MEEGWENTLSSIFDSLCSFYLEEEDRERERERERERAREKEEAAATYSFQFNQRCHSDQPPDLPPARHYFRKQEPRICTDKMASTELGIARPGGG